MTDSFLTWRASKPMQRKLSDAMKGFLPAAFERLRDGYVPSNEPTDPLAEVIKDTANLLKQLGSEVPLTVEDSERLERAILRPDDPEGDEPTEEDIEEATARMLLEMPAQAMNPALSALYAYRYFMYGVGFAKDGNAVAAAQAVADGAIYLARATYLTASGMAAQGGNAKVAKNSKAAQIAEAKQEAHVFWKERHAGKHPNLANEDRFAIEVCRKWPVLTSIGTIKSWSTKWRKQAKIEARRAKLGQS